MPDLQPTLVGETVIIRPLCESDWAEMFAAASDREIWALHPAQERYKEAEFRKFFDGGMESKGAFALIEQSSGTIIGSSRYYDHDPERREIYIGYTFLVRGHWGDNTNREVKRLMLDHAFSFVDRVVFHVGETNWRSQRAMEKIGGLRREALEDRLGGGASVVFEIRKENYKL